MITHVQIVKLFQDIATNHYQVNGFGFGDPWEYLASEEPDTICIWGVLNPSTRNGNEVLLNYSLLIFDYTKDDESDKNEALSNCHRVALDVISILSSPTYQDQFILSASNQMDDFTERFTSKVTGWKLDLTFRVFFDNDACLVPSSGMPELAGNFVAIADINTGTILQQLYAGSTYYVSVWAGIDAGNATTNYTDGITLAE